MKTNSCIYNQMPSNHLLKKSESMATFAKFSSRSKPCVWERKNVFTCLNTGDLSGDNQCVSYKSG